MRPPMADALDRNAVIQLLAQTIALFASGDEASGRAMVADLAAGFAKERQGTLPGLPSPPPRVDAFKAAAARVFTYWQERCEHPHARMSPERERAIVARLRQNYSESELKCAIDGAAADAFVNQAGRKFDDVELICRNGSKLESFIDRGIAAGSTHNVGLLDHNGALTTPAGSVDLEQEIAQLRHNMSVLHREGRDTEYAAATKKLADLLAARRAGRHP